ncbi:MAG TPA: hypothetical protein VMU82_00670 [Acetobacteraceae bacterium]|nr:hypothetical protein [Acetobacteraceae bacterium]
MDHDTASLASLTQAEMELLARRAGLTLNAGQMADLVLAWKGLAPLAAAIPRARPMTDDQAYVFRLPPPLPPPAPKPAVRRK